jgi:hypothetical protein
MRAALANGLPKAAAARAPAGREPLTVKEILELEGALIEVFRTIRELRLRTPAARYIKFPPLPSLWSKSIALVAIPTLFGPEWRGRYGGRIADVIAENAAAGSTMKVEVKATGRHAFQELKEKDLRADFLVWLRFGRRLELGSGPIEVAVLEAPGKYIDRQCRLDVRRFEGVVGILEAQKILRFDSLAAMLSPGSSAGR